MRNLARNDCGSGPQFTGVHSENIHTIYLKQVCHSRKRMAYALPLLRGNYVTFFL